MEYRGRWKELRRHGYFRVSALFAWFFTCELTLFLCIFFILHESLSVFKRVFIFYFLCVLYVLSPHYERRRIYSNLQCSYDY